MHISAAPPVKQLATSVKAWMLLPRLHLVPALPPGAKPLGDVHTAGGGSLAQTVLAGRRGAGHCQSGRPYLPWPEQCS